ncbi:MAG: GGDEF domain-containing protein [Gemmatimonadetes bacterium]|nr:GGDEF domain-containing protein [Gemmatimonadota bacterium]
MNSVPTNLIIASLGPFAELIGVVALVALFTLLRGQADRRPYFKAWEESWVMLAVSLTAGVIYQRLTDPTSVLLSDSRAATWLFAAAYFAFRLLALARLVFGARVYVNGARERWFFLAAAPAGVALSIVVETSRTQLGQLGLAVGPFAVAAYLYGAARLAAMPPSRRSLGSRLATLAMGALALAWTGLTVFHLAARLDASLAGVPSWVRFERYGFFIELALQLALGYAMVRLLFEDGRRDATDTQAHLKVLHDRALLADFYDDETGLLNRKALDHAVGLDFAMASFGSVARVRVADLASLTQRYGAKTTEALVTHFAGVLSSGVRTHDWVFRWAPTEFIVVMPRAVPGVAHARLDHLLTRAAPFAIAGVRDSVRAEATVSIAPYSGAEDLSAAIEQTAREAPPA